MLESLAYIFISGITFGELFRRLGLPSLVGMLLGGVVLGPFVLDALHGEILTLSGELREVALVIILFRSGLALNLRELRGVGRSAALMSFLPALFEIAAIAALAPWLLGVSVLEGIIIGTVVAAVSPAVIVPRMLEMIQRGKGSKKGIPQMIMGAASIDDILVIVLFGAAVSLENGMSINVGMILNLPLALLLGLLVGVFSGWAMSVLFKAVHMRDSLKVLLLLSLGFLFLRGEDYLQGAVPFSSMLAVITMGVVLLNRYPLLANRISPKFNKLWVGAEIVLFTLVGASLNLPYLLGVGWSAVIIISLALVVRMAGVWISTSGSHLDVRERIFCMVAFTPKATVQAAIGGIPLAMGLPCGEIVLTVAIASIILTAPVGAAAIDRLGRKIY